jgi:hypothetical protein
VTIYAYIIVKSLSYPVSLIRHVTENLVSLGEETPEENVFSISKITHRGVRRINCHVSFKLYVIKNCEYNKRSWWAVYLNEERQDARNTNMIHILCYDYSILSYFY